MALTAQRVRQAHGDAWQTVGAACIARGGGVLELPGVRLMATGLHHPQFLEQLDQGGRMVLPVGPLWAGQELVRVEKLGDGTLRTESLLPVRFVKMIG